MKKNELDKQNEAKELNHKLKKIQRYIEQGYADHQFKIKRKNPIDVANDFKYVALKIYENNLSNVSSKNKLLNPFVMNAIFSIEVYLKIILKSLNADKISGHDLKILFDEINNLDKNIFEVLVKKYKIETSNNLSEFMEKYKNAFENFRYSYEGYNQDGTIDCSKILLEFNDAEIMCVMILLSDYCNNNCKGVSFCD